MPVEKIFLLSEWQATEALAIGRPVQQIDCLDQHIGPELDDLRLRIEDLAILTGGRVIARDLGGRLEQITSEDLGSAERVRTNATHTSVVHGGGDKAAIAARRVQVQRQYDNAPDNDEAAMWVETDATATDGAMPMKINSGVSRKPPPMPNIPDTNPTAAPIARMRNTLIGRSAIGRYSCTSVRLGCRREPG